MRRTRRVVAAALATVVAAAGVVAIIEIVNAASGDGYLIVDWPGWVAAAARNTWSDTGPRLAAGALAAVGVVLLVLGLRPGPPERFAVSGPLGDPSGRTTTFVTRRGLAHALRSAALAIDGVTGASLRVRRRRATARLRVDTRTATDAPARAHSALAARLGAFHLARPPTLRVRIRTVRPPRRDRRIVPEPPTALPAGTTHGTTDSATHSRTDGTTHGVTHGTNNGATHGTSDGIARAGEPPSGGGGRGGG